MEARARDGRGKALALEAQTSSDLPHHVFTRDKAHPHRPCIFLMAVLPIMAVGRTLDQRDVALVAGGTALGQANVLNHGFNKAPPLIVVIPKPDHGIHSRARGETFSIPATVPPDCADAGQMLRASLQPEFQVSPV